MIFQELVEKLNQDLPDSDCCWRFVKRSNDWYNLETGEGGAANWVGCESKEAEKVEIQVLAYDCEYAKRYICDFEDYDKFERIYQKSIRDCEECPE